jgi:prolyl-tRNA editing enzyme YbaK/EbsC (Cys-tRNA(Pro) deacylase)
VNHKLKDIAGFKRLSFADAELTKEVTGMELGAVTPVGLTGKDIPVYVDQPIMSLSFIILGAGVRSQKIKTTPDLFNKIPYSQIVEISQ